MTITKVLKDTKIYIVPEKEIIWNIDCHTLKLSVTLFWDKYEKSGLKLPPEELGRCKDWYVRFTNNSAIKTFVATWDIRRIKNNMENIDIINENIKLYAINK